MTLNELAATVRGRRQDLGISQAALAERAGVSRKWIYEFEAGKQTAELGLVLRVLDALGIDMTLEPRSDKPSSDAVVALHAALARTRQSRPVSSDAGGGAAP